MSPCRLAEDGYARMPARDSHRDLGSSGIPGLQLDAIFHIMQLVKTTPVVADIPDSLIKRGK